MPDTKSLCTRAALATAAVGAALAGAAGTAAAAPLALTPSTPGTTTTQTGQTSSLSAEVVGPMIGQLQCELQTVATTTTYEWDPVTQSCTVYVLPTS